MKLLKSQQLFSVFIHLVDLILIVRCFIHYCYYFKFEHTTTVQLPVYVYITGLRRCTACHRRLRSQVGHVIGRGTHLYREQSDPIMLCHMC